MVSVDDDSSVLEERHTERKKGVNKKRNILLSCQFM